MSLVSLTYMSAAVSVPMDSELQQLLGKARKRNAELAVTGVLLYSGGTFLQYLEGPADAVEHVWRIIRVDPMHHNILEMDRGEIGNRLFPEWSMAVRAPSGSFREFGGPELTSRLASPEPGVFSAARILLSSFWETAVSGRFSQFYPSY